MTFCQNRRCHLAPAPGSSIKPSDRFLTRSSRGTIFISGRFTERDDCKRPIAYHARMVWFTLIGVLLACGLLLAVLAATLLAWGLTHPPRMGDGKALAILHRLSPADLGLRYTDVRFQVIDESNPPAKITIVGWWIPADSSSDRCAILLHGYADAKIGAIAWAPIFHSLGWNVLAIDLRAHGESGGEKVTGGHFERHDLSHVIDQLLERQPAETKQIVLFGVSMGSAIATQVAAMRDDVAGVIAESFVGSFIFASHAQTHLMGLPGGIVGQIAAHLAAGYDDYAERIAAFLQSVNSTSQ